MAIPAAISLLVYKTTSVRGGEETPRWHGRAAAESRSGSAAEPGAKAKSPAQPNTHLSPNPPLAALLAAQGSHCRTGVASAPHLGIRAAFCPVVPLGLDEGASLGLGAEEKWSWRGCGGCGQIPCIPACLLPAP